MLLMLRALWSYRFFVLSSIRNDLVSRFARSKLGLVWMILNPLALVLIYSLVLSNVLAARLPEVDGKYAYSVYLMAGLVAWNLFNDLITRCLTLFIEQGNLLKKVAFPRITLPVIVAGSVLINNIILLLAVLLISMILGQTFGFVLLWLFPLTTLVLALGLGLGLMLGVMNVFVRDIGQVVPIILQILFWLTPIVYPLTILPEDFQLLIGLNPLHSIVAGYQQVILYNSPPVFSMGLSVMAFLSLLLICTSLFVFRRASSEMVDVL